jgi:hypothetical protein
MNPALAFTIVVAVAAFLYGALFGGVHARRKRAWYDYRGSVRQFRRRRRIAFRRIGDVGKVVVIPIAMIAFVLMVLMVGKG